MNWSLTCKGFLKYVGLPREYDNTPPAGPHYLNLLNHTWPSDRQVVSLISGQGYFTFPYIHTKHNLHGGRKENKLARTWVSSKRKEGEVCDNFLAFCQLSRACIRAKSHSHHERWLICSCWLNRFLSPHILAVTCSLPCNVDFSDLHPSLDFGTFLPSSPSGLLGHLACNPFVWVSRQKRKRNLLTGTYPRPHNECPTSCYKRFNYYRFQWLKYNKS